MQELEGIGGQLKVLRVVGGLEASFGGPSVSTVEACIASQQAGIETSLVFPSDRTGATPNQYAVDELLVEGVAVHWFPRAYPARGWSRRWGFSPRLLVWLGCSVRGFDVVHFHGAWTFTTLAGSIVARLAGCPVVLTPHETLTDFDVHKSGPLVRLVKRTLRRAYLGWFDLVITASHLELRDSKHDTSRARFVALHHPVVSYPHRSSSPKTRAGFNLRIGFLGRLDPKKNVDVLIRILAALPDAVTLHVAGQGAPDFSLWLRALAREHKVDQRITWLGFLSDEQKGPFFESIDLLALPSAYECFGRAAAEAMLAGVPVLVSSECGVAQVVRAGGGGFVTAPTDDAVEETLRSLLSDRSQLAVAAPRAAASARAEFSPTAHGTRLRREYESLLADRARARSSRRAGQAVSERK